ncbi:MAG: putative lipoprotein NlpC [Campylobacterota bacterium]|nr:putative lipoprotein NlpC [Campylobacterota bacterium]MDQ1338537.1 putative lipoprotein NlpC [Campylobacterota bacterium]
MIIKKYFFSAFLILASTLSAQNNVAENQGRPYILVDKVYETHAKGRVVSKAQEFLGTAYGFGNKNSRQTDCSGFTQQVFKEIGITLPRSAAEQSKIGSTVDVNNLEIGDLLFYKTYKKEPSHVAIYAGDGQMIHASFRNRQVQYDAIDKAYYKKRFIYAKRLSIVDKNASGE